MAWSLNYESGYSLAFTALAHHETAAWEVPGGGGIHRSAAVGERMFDWPWTDLDAQLAIKRVLLPIVTPKRYIEILTTFCAGFFIRNIDFSERRVILHNCGCNSPPSSFEEEISPTG